MTPFMFIKPQSRNLCRSPLNNDRLKKYIINHAYIAYTLLGPVLQNV